jgi:hypothetical protein
MNMESTNMSNPSEQVSEMTINLPMVSPPPMAQPEAPAEVASSDAAYTEPSDTIAIGAPYTKHDPRSVTVYANTITPVQSASMDDAIACFDVVFSVGIDCGEGVCKTYQVVKRIGIDKCKMACDAECSSPVSVVESKTDALKEAATATRKRFRVLAGLE